MARIYTASSWRNANYEFILSILIKSLPQHSFYDFKNPIGGNGFGWDEIDKNWTNWTMDKFREVLDTNHRAREGFISDKTGLDWCDICILLLPCGRSAHLELGYAVGRGKTTAILLTENFEPELMYKFVDYIATDVRFLIEFLKRIPE